MGSNDFLNMLAEASTKEISKKKAPKGLDQNKKVAREGGTVAGVARAEIERQTGESVISSANTHSFKKAISKPKKKS